MKRTCITRRGLALTILIWFFICLFIMVQLPVLEERPQYVRGNRSRAIHNLNDAEIFIKNLEYRHAAKVNKVLLNLKADSNRNYRAMANAMDSERKAVKKLIRDLQINMHHLLDIKESVKELNIPLAKVLGEKMDNLGKMIAASASTSIAPVRHAVIPSDGAGVQDNIEVIRRQLESSILSLWHLLRTNLEHNKLDKSHGLRLTNIRTRVFQYYRSIRNTMYEWESLSDGWRISESKRLGSLVQARIAALQNPTNCSTAKFTKCRIFKPCGLLCQIHHVVYCLIMSLSMGRVMVLDEKGWTYDARGWVSWFLPLGTSCTIIPPERNIVMYKKRKKFTDLEVLEIPFIDYIMPAPPQHPLSIPEDIAADVARFHSFPAIWWIGQVFAYVWRLQPALAKEISDYMNTIKFTHPIVGVHVRRSDKIRLEAKRYEVEQYMEHVIEYYDMLKRRSNFSVKELVYLATDDDSVLADAKTKYPNFRFISDLEVSRKAGIMGTRYSKESLKGVIYDVYLLSMCDYLVCTFSSNVCRGAFELMQARHGDASSRFFSLDELYYYGGQSKHEMRAIEDHDATGRGELSFVRDDIINIQAYLQNGTAMGINKRTLQRGSFPSYKLVEKVNTFKFSEFSNVKF